jgi:hypothetical protein
MGIKIFISNINFDLLDINGIGDLYCKRWEVEKTYDRKKQITYRKFFRKKKSNNSTGLICYCISL